MDRHEFSFPASFALLTAITTSVACSGRSEDGPPEAGLPSCLAGAKGASLVAGLNPAVELQAIALIRLDDEHRVLSVVENEGALCPDEASEELCLASFERPLVGFYTADDEVPHALYVRIDDVGGPLDYRAMRDVLGSIDTANEAAVMAWSEGWAVSCEAIKQIADGYQIVVDGECASEDGHVVISRDGTVSHSAHCVR